MARDVEKRFQAIERLLRQGRGAAATRELHLMAEDLSKDPLILNRVGDLLARNGQKDEAVRLYDRIAEELFRAGFYPRANAVLKKTLRLHPGHLPAVLLLGETYAKQNLPGEARSHLLASAEQFLRAREALSARRVSERLVAIDPKEPRHRVRLAEVKASQGDVLGALDDLLHAAEDLTRAGHPSEAEKAYRRAADLAPERPEPISGLARALALQQRSAEALRVLEESAGKPEMSAVFSGELFLLHEQEGRTEEAARFLGEERSDLLTDDVIERMLSWHVDHGTADQAWSRLDVLLARWRDQHRVDRLTPLLGRLAQLEGQEMAALERLHRIQKAASDGSPVLQQSLPRQRAQRPSANLDVVPAQSPPSEAGATARLAIPETHADQEFAVARLTQAEVFQKYGLMEQAMAQIREVTARFPGHVVASERLVALLRTRKDREGLRGALVGMALARISAEDGAGAHEAVRMASELGPLPQADLASLREAGLQAPGSVEGRGRIPAAVPPPDAVEEIVFFLTQGMEWDALERIATLRREGYHSDELDDLERRAAARQRGSAPADEPLLSDDLGSEPAGFAEVEEDTGTEQSVEDVFRAFKEQIANEVDSGDSRTHYELGIAYKEMGLVDDAIDEFETASRSPAFFRDACSMLSLCHRERGDLAQAVRWYRSALEFPGGDTASVQGLRYDLAEVLLECGDVEGALEMFAHILQVDPSYRDVGARVGQLKPRDHS